MWFAIALITVSSTLLSVEDFGTLSFSAGSLFIVLACICWGIENNCTRIVSKEPVNVGEIGIFTMEGEGYVKELGRGVLHSLNQKYEDIPLTEDVRCNGKVVGVLDPKNIFEE